MHRKLHVRRVAVIVGVLMLVALAVYAVHTYQIQRNAHRLLELGDRALKENDLDKARTCYSHYLRYAPNDTDTAQKYAEVLDRTGSDFWEMMHLMEQVLRLKPNEAALRMRFVEHLIVLDRFRDALHHLGKLIDQQGENPDLYHKRGWCQDAAHEYAEAAASYRKAVKLNSKQIRSYALLAEVLQDRLHEPDEATKVIDEMVKANDDAFLGYLLRSRFRRQRAEAKGADDDLKLALKQADEDLQMAMKLGPHEAAVLLEAARVKGNSPEAVALLEDGRKRYPHSPEFYKRLANIRIATGKREEAIELLRDGARACPQANDLSVLLIDLQIDKQQYSSAETAINKLRKTRMRPTLLDYLTGRLLVAQKKWPEATRILEHVRQELGPRSDWNSRVHVLLGVCYRQIEDREHELLAFRRAVNDEPEWTDAVLGLATALLDSGRVEEAITLLEPMRKDLPAEYWLLLTRAYLERQARAPGAEVSWTKLEGALAKAAELKPKSIDEAILHAEMLAARKEFAKAQALLESCKATHPQEIIVWCALAALQARQNHWSDAEKILEQAAQQGDFGKRVELQIAKARLWSRHGTPEDRAKLARLSDGLDNSAPLEARVSLQRELAETWYRLGDWGRAERFWRRIADEQTRDLHSRARLLDLSLLKNQSELARKWLAEIRKIEGDQGSLWRYGVAAILVREAHGKRSKLEQARTMLGELKRIQQDWPRAAVLSATIFELEGRYKEAIQEYMRALDLGETQPWMMTRLMTLLLERHEHSKADEALGKYEQKLPLTPDLARLGAEAALGMRDRGYAKVALRRGEQAVTLPTRDYRDLVWLARICRAAGDNARAEKLLRDAVDIAGHAPDTWLALAEHFAQTNEPDKATKELERLNKELPKDRQALTKARFFETLHRSTEAAQAYQNALAKSPDDVTLLAFAAEFYRQADQASDAVKLYERLLAPEVAAPAELTVKARRNLAILLAERGDEASRKRALALVDDNRRNHGDTIADERIHLYILGISKQSQDRLSALNRFQESKRQTPLSPEEQLLLAQMLEVTNEDNLLQARTELADLVQRYPTPAHLVRYAHALMKKGGDLEEAEAIVARLIALEPVSERTRGVQAALVQAKETQKKNGAVGP